MREQEFKQISNELKALITTAIDKLADDIGELILAQAEDVEPSAHVDYVRGLAREAMDYVIYEVTGGKL